MKKNLICVSVTLAVMTIIGCKSNPNKAEELDTKIEKNEAISSNEEVGVKGGNMVIQKKVMMGEELRRLQIDVYSLEDRVYGNRKYGSLGLYGVLRDCRMNVSDKKNGGDGKLMWTEPLERVTDKEDEFKIGLDEKDKIIGLKEEFLNDRLTRFKGYKSILEKRQDEYEEKLAICQSDLLARRRDQESKENR